MQYRIVNISADQFECSCPWAYFSQSVESAPVTQMNFQWREGVYHKCALYEELIRDDCKVLGCIMRFYEENCRRRNVSVPKRTTRQHAGPWKRPYSDMPSFLSQSEICCIAATKISLRANPLSDPRQRRVYTDKSAVAPL